MSRLHSVGPYRHIQALHRVSILELDHDDRQHWMPAFLLLQCTLRKHAMGCLSTLAIDQRRILEHCEKWKGMGLTHRNACYSPATRYHLPIVPEDLLSDTNGRHNAEAAERSPLCVRWI